MPRQFSIALLLGFATLLLGATASLLRPPMPNIQDEFSYLLAADTFASGRLTNPTHPMWQHFETMHVIHQPSYASKYPPGQGAMLALGQATVGWPIAGVWLSSAFAVMACYWMLYGMVSPKWALVGSFVLLIHPSFQLGWGQCFWGGTLAFLGGALVLGAAVRIDKRLLVRDSLLMAAGAIVLAVTRPFEGFVFCVLVGGWVIFRWARRGWPPMGVLLKRAVTPQLVVFVLGGLAIASYNFAVTNSLSTMPYQVHEEAYSVCPLFLWQALAEGQTFLHDSMAMLHDGWSLEWYHQQQSLNGFLQTKWGFLLVTLYMLLPLPVAVPLLTIFWWRGKRLRGPLLLLIFTWLITQMTIWNYPHYLAPAAPVFLILVVYGLRNLHVATREWQTRFRPVTALIAVQACLLGYSLWERCTTPDDNWHYKRQAILEQLEEEPGQHLVLVEYSPSHDPLAEWIYNRADIDQAKVVWARPIDSARQEALLNYFSGHKVWLLQADDQEPQIVAYQPTGKGKLASASLP